jgi:hypothetical protein
MTFIIRLLTKGVNSRGLLRDLPYALGANQRSEPRIPLSTKADGEPVWEKVRVSSSPLGKKD